jgi:2-C-methyl-D-erythritol 4-phosphate cytidylyltransferase
MSTWAVVVAAGSGERLAQPVPKAFARLRGRPLLAESIERLDASAWIDGIVVCVPEGWEEPAILLAEEIGAGKVAQAIAGGPTRAESVRLGVREVPSEALVIAVHDAARPIMSESVLDRVLAAIGEGWDGAVPALPLSDTVKRVVGDAIAETVPRDDLVAAQTPQAFAAGVLRSALEGDLAGATDCAGLVEARGGRVRAVEGDPRLLKITSAADLALVECLLAEDGAA